MESNVAIALAAKMVRIFPPTAAAVLLTGWRPDAGGVIGAP